jgi:hypothetical protein
MLGIASDGPKGIWFASRIRGSLARYFTQLHSCDLSDLNGRSSNEIASFDKRSIISV